MHAPPPSGPRQPKCARCRHHGSIILKKGHRSCPFLTCDCWKCQLVTRARIRRSLKRARAGPGGGRPPAGGPAGPPPPPSGGPQSFSPLDLRTRRPDPGGEPVSDRRDLLSGSSPVGDFRQMVPLPTCHFPFRMPDHFPPPPDFLFHFPGLPPVPGGLHDGVCSPLMFPHLQQGPVFYLPPSEDLRRLFFTIHPLPPPPESLPGGADVQAATSTSSV